MTKLATGLLLVCLAAVPASTQAAPKPDPKVLVTPAEASAIIAKVYNLDPAVTEKVVRALLASEKKGGVPYWGPGDLRIDNE